MREKTVETPSDSSPQQMSLLTPDNPMPSAVAPAAAAALVAPSANSLLTPAVTRVLEWHRARTTRSVQ